MNLRVFLHACVALILGTFAAAAAAQLNVSYGQAIKQLYGFRMQNSPLADGTKRSLGMSPDSGAVLELVGPHENLRKASLIIAVPNDAPRVVAENSGRLLRFVANTMPGWKDGAAWVNRGLKKIVGGDYSDQMTVIGSRRITMSSMKAGALILVSVEPA